MAASKGLCRVCIVEDSATVRERLQSLVESMPGCALAGHASDARSATRMVEEERPHVVLLDLRLEEGTGMTVLAHAKQLEPAPFVIVLTNFAHEEYRRSCEKLGADAFLDKSSEFDQVSTLLEGLVAP